MDASQYLQISPEVSDALRHNLPVVALESTIIAHGMPYPQNVETALAVEAELRNNGAVPATIAIIDGKWKAGLNSDELQLLGELGPKAIKTSRRDLPHVMATGGTGATTVATTMIIAERAGIPIFATGGIGGVHRGAAVSMDVSADLQELANCQVAVVCAGAKAILDLGLTLEYLETYGVPVIGYQTDEFPAFYSRKSGLGVDYRADSPEELARLLRAKKQAGLRGGLLVANPIPERAEMEYDFIQKAIEQAVKTSINQKISGKEVSPFLLAEISRITGGESLYANIELVRNNARLAAAFAVAFSNLNT